MLSGAFWRATEVSEKGIDKTLEIFSFAKFVDLKIKNNKE